MHTKLRICVVYLSYIRTNSYFTAP